MNTAYVLRMCKLTDIFIHICNAICLKNNGGVSGGSVPKYTKVSTLNALHLHSSIPLSQAATTSFQQNGILSHFRKYIMEVLIQLFEAGLTGVVQFCGNLGALISLDLSFGAV